MNTILSLVLLVIAIASITYYIINSYSHPWFSLIAFIIFVPSLIIGLGLYQPVNPTKQDVIDGKACLEEISTWYDGDNDLVTIEYVIMDKYGDFEETKQIIVSASEIEKHISK